MVFWDYFILSSICIFYSLAQGTNNEEMVDIAAMDTNNTELIKGMPETLRFTLNTMTNRTPIVLNLKRKKSVKENSFVFVVRRDKNGKMVLVKENIPVKRNVGLYQDKKTGAAFTVQCEGLEHGRCNPVLFGSIHIDNVEYDLSEISTADMSSTTTASPVARRKRRAKKQKDKHKKKQDKKEKKERKWNEKQKKKEEKKQRKMKRRIYKLTKKNKNNWFDDDLKIFDNHVTNNIIRKETSQPLGRAMPLRMTENIVDISKEKLPVLGRTVVSSSRSRVNVAADDTYNVELLLVIDHSIYMREYNAINDPGVFNKDMEAKARIRQYFGHTVNGINLRYDNIETNKFHINVAVSGYIIADKPDIAVWTAKRSAGNPRDLVDSDDALDLLRSWRMEVSQLPEHDHLMLFTAYDLYRYRTADNKVTGLASFRAMCSASSVSIVEDNGVHGSISTGTHELAHSLGARHDGSGTNICSSSSQYIMAGTGGVARNGNELNPWKFSPCSIDELYSFLSGLGPGSCLSDEALIYDMDEFNQVTRNEIGQIYDANEQCRQRAGKDSFYGWGGGLGEFTDICTSMACKSDTSKNSYLIYTAARGTSCGNQKWCLNGLCASDPDAPEKDEKCVHGDSQKLFDGQTCPQLISDDPSKCYEKYYKEFCCQTCKNIAKPIPGCEYGDKNSFCSTTSKRPHLCYSQRNSEICCDSCQSLNTGYQGCEYGDKVHEVLGGTCYKWRCSGNPDYQKSCCQTCGIIPDTPIVPKTTQKPKIVPATTKQPIQPVRPRPVITTKAPTVRPRPPIKTRPPPTTNITPSGELCVRSDGVFRSMTCSVVAKWISDICQVSVLQDACCEPCATRTIASACQDTDTCSNVKAINCYDNFVRERCCATCKSFETGDEGCMYGDKSSSCTRYVFLWPDYICSKHPDKCCSSCKNRSSRRSTVTILSRRMENSIANVLDSPPTKSPFVTSIDSNNNIDASVGLTDQPTRGDQIPIKKEKKKNDKGKNKKWQNENDNFKDKHNDKKKGKGKGKGKHRKHWHRKGGKWRHYHG
ncbi:uncharacterized protein LOC127705137 [Mytilus californianus]|uniref:uncharacterized protein LOC127705137 n=1 Tax=Mytilus californianus TaxID=6549 RepID=UPI002246142A|nr:uncharacterized protein LOC127705137 [Mytilus californianus]